MPDTPVSNHLAKPHAKKRQTKVRAERRRDAPALFLTADVTAGLEQQLGAAGFASARFGGDAVRSALDASGDKAAGPLGIVWSGPERGIVAALLEGADPALSLENWRAEAEQLIGLFRRFRRRLVLINDNCFADPSADAEREAIRQRFDLSAMALQVLREPSSGNTREEGGVSAAHVAAMTWLTRVAIPHDPRLKGMLAELSASSIIPLRPADVAKIGAGQAFAALSALHEERDLLREQILLNIKELDDLDASARADRASVEALTAKLDRQSDKLTALTNENAALQGNLSAYAARAEAEAALAVQGFDQSGRFMDLIERVSLGTGVERSDGVIRLSAASAQSHGIYGPYLTLDPGKYEVCVAFSMTPRGLGEPVAVIEVVHNVDDLLAMRRFEGSKLKSQHFIMREVVTIPPRTSEADRPEFELRLWTDQIKHAEVGLAYVRRL